MVMLQGSLAIVWAGTSPGSGGGAGSGPMAGVDFTATLDANGQIKIPITNANLYIFDGQPAFGESMSAVYTLNRVSNSDVNFLIGEVANFQPADIGKVVTGRYRPA
jgi:hypothetical protein